MNKPLSRTKKNLLYALIGGSLFWPLPPTAAIAAASTQPLAPPAQTAPEQREFALEGVEVSAAKDTTDNGYVAKRSSVGTKTDTPLNEAAQSISVVTREQLDVRAVQSLADAIAYTPGYSIKGETGDARGYTGTGIRGFSNAIYTDGLRLMGGDFAWPDTEIYAFERIEILRGPSSVLYGTNSPGGLYNQVTKRPPAEDLREIRLQAGTKSLANAAIDIGGPANADGSLLFRLTGLTSEKNYPVDHTSGARRFFAPALTWKPNEKTNLTLLTIYQKDDTKGFNYGNVAVRHPGDLLYGYPGTLFYGEPDFDRFLKEQKQIGYILEHQFDDTWSLTQTARHTNVTVDYKASLPMALNAGILERGIWHTATTLNSDAIDTHLQAKWSQGKAVHTSLIGFDYTRLKYDSSTYYGGSGALPSLNLNTLNYGQAIPSYTLPPASKSALLQRGVYLQDQLKFGERWVAVVSGRRGWYESGTLKQTANTGRAGLVYHATSELSPYVSYSESFEPQSGHDRYGKAFEPTTGRQYELGIQYEPAGMQARFTAALFDLRQQNVLTADPLNEIYPNAPAFNVQTGEVASKGLELEATFGPFKGLNLTASYTLLDNKITKDNDPAKLGRHTAGISRHGAALWADYSLPDGKLKNWGFGGGIRYLGSRYNSNNAVKLGGVVLADAMVRYDMDEWRLALNVQNVFNRRYEATYGYAGPERSAILTATRRW